MPPFFFSISGKSYFFSLFYWFPFPVMSQAVSTLQIGKQGVKELVLTIPSPTSQCVAAMGCPIRAIALEVLGEQPACVRGMNLAVII